jgi:hypothetical protein
MPEEPRPPRRRPRGRRRGGSPRPQQAPAQPERPSPARNDRVTPRDRPAPRGDRPAPRPDRRPAPRAGGLSRDQRNRRGGRARLPRPIDEIRTGTACVVLLDCREGEPDRSGSPALFEGFFDFETGEPRRSGSGIPRLRVGDERLWGFECWWRLDTERSGLTDTDREDLETSKRLLRGLLRDARRSTRPVR